MKMNTMLFVLAAVVCAAGVQAQAPSSDQGQAAAQTKEQKKAAWENGVKTDCSAEIATGGICAGKDFGTGLEKCLHKNRKKLSDGCRVAVHPHHKGMKGHKDGASTDGAQTGGATQQAPAATPQK